MARDAIPGSPEEAAIKKIGQFFSGRQSYTLEDLHRIKSNIDGLVRYGDSTIGIQPGALANAQYQITGIRRELDDILRNASPDYARVMDKYSTSIDKLNAFEPCSMTESMESYPILFIIAFLGKYLHLSIFLKMQ